MLLAHRGGGLVGVVGTPLVAVPRRGGGPPGGATTGDLLVMLITTTFCAAPSPSLHVLAMRVHDLVEEIVVAHGLTPGVGGTSSPVGAPVFLSASRAWFRMTTAAAWSTTWRKLLS